jgi:hypothetical protein
MLDIMKLVYDKRFNFLFINTDTARMFKNWDEIKFQEDDEDSE